jgi:DNA-binding CsgD family transcriptional regulator
MISKEVIYMTYWPRNLIANIFGYKAGDKHHDAEYSDEYVAFVISLMLTTVPKNVEEAILYHFKDGLTYEEIGVKMNCSKSKVQLLRSKGIRQLKCTGLKEIEKAMRVTNICEALYEKIKENESLEEEISSLKRNLAISKELHPMLDEEIRLRKEDVK